MFRKDWIMRLTEECAQVLAKVLFNKQESRHAESHQLIDQLLRQYFTLNRDLLVALSAEDCLRLANGFGESRPEVGLALVDLMVADGEVSLMEGRGDLATVLFERAQSCLQLLPLGQDDQLRAEVSRRSDLISGRLQAE